MLGWLIGTYSYMKLRYSFVSVLSPKAWSFYIPFVASGWVTASLKTSGFLFDFHANPFFSGPLLADKTQMAATWVCSACGIKQYDTSWKGRLGTGTGLGAWPSRLACLIRESFSPSSLIHEAEEGGFAVKEPCRRQSGERVLHCLSVAPQCWA